MTPSPIYEIGAFLLKCAGHIGKVPAGVLRAVWLGTVSMAGVLSQILRTHHVEDIKRYKTSLLDKERAKADAAIGEARRKLADAAEAANKATLPKRRDRFAQLERERKAAEIDKTRAETEKTRADAKATIMDAETRRFDAETRRQAAEIANAKARLLKAISHLRQQGGDVFFSEENLKQIINHELVIPPPALPSDDSELEHTGSDTEAEKPQE